MSKAFQKASYCASCKMKSQEHDINAEQTEIIAPNLEEIVSCCGFAGNVSCQRDRHFCYLWCICLFQNVCFIVSKHRYSLFLLSNAVLAVICGNTKS